MSNVNKIKSDSLAAQPEATLEFTAVAQESAVVEEKTVAKERDEKGPWALWSELKPPATKCVCACSDLTENELLTEILVKYGNNAESIPTLLYAISQNDVPAVDLLLKHGASPFVTHGNKPHSYNCLYYAIKVGNIELFKRFIDLGLHPDQMCGDGKMPLHFAITYNRNDIAKYLINYGVVLNIDKNEVDYLRDCATFGNLEIYHILLSKGTIFANRTHFIRGLLTMRSSNKAQKIEMLNHCLDQKIIDPNELLKGGYFYRPIEWGLNDNTTQDISFPLLYYAASPHAATADLLRILLERGADANALTTKLRRNVFHNLMTLMTESKNNFDTQKEMIELLVRYGADINHKDSKGNTPLQLATGSRLIDFLKSLGAR